MTRRLRLRGRSAGELRERLAQKLAAAAERVGITDLAEPDAHALRARLREGERGHYEGLDPWSRGLLRGRFFPSFDDPAATAEAAVALDPGFPAWCLDRAARALDGRFDLLGFRDLAWGIPIDWHREPRSGVRAPVTHWSAIPYLDSKVVGDHKLLWELNRHHILVTIAQAARITGDRKWSEACLNLLDDWMTANPPGRGVNWASSLEVSFRSIAWLWVLHLLPEPLPERLAVRVAGHFLHAGRHLERYLSTYFSPNTHLTGEALGLLYLGTQLPQFSSASRWRDKGWHILQQQLARHIHADGVYFEQSTWYHRYTVDFYLHALVLAGRNGLAVPGEMRERLVLALDHLMSVTRPDGTMPLLGDDDGGKLVVLDERTQHDCRAPLAQGAVLLERADYAGIAAGAGAELAWLLGASAARRFTSMVPTDPTWASRGFATGGYYVMRDGWRGSPDMMVLDCGPHGVLNHGHAHADALAFDLTVGGHPVLVDPGTGTYTTSAGIRDRFRSSAVHNVVTVDGQSSSTMAGPFHWHRVSRAEAEAWVASGSADYFRGTHDGYDDLPDPVSLRRTVLFVKGNYWVIRDDVVAHGAHEIMLTFQAAAGISMTPGAADAIACRRGDVSVLTLLKLDWPEGASFVVESGCVSPTYGVWIDAPAARGRAHTRGRASFTTLLVPGDARAVSAKVLESAPGHATFELSGAFGRDVVRLGSTGAWAAAGLRGDVAAAWVRRSASGAVVDSFACDGSSLEVDGVPHHVWSSGTDVHPVQPAR